MTRIQIICPFPDRPIYDAIVDGERIGSWSSAIDAEAAAKDWVRRHPLASGAMSIYEALKAKLGRMTPTQTEAYRNRQVRWACDWQAKTRGHYFLQERAREEGRPLAAWLEQENARESYKEMWWRLALVIGVNPND